MNSFTLEFKDKKLSSMYEKQEYFISIQYYSLIIFCIGGCLMCGFTVLTNLEKIKNSDNLQSLFLGIVCLVGLILAMKYPDFSNAGLFIINLVMSVNGSELPKSYDVYNGYLIGSSMMMGHTCVLFIMTYKISLLNTILLCVLRLFFSAQNTNVSLVQYVITIGITIIFMIALYFVERFKRQSFLINCKDDMLDIIISECSGRPLYIFTYNQKSCQFDLIVSEQTFEFQYVLNEIKYKNQKIKHYLLERIKQQIQTQYLNVHFKNKHHIIKIQQRMIYYILTIETMDQLVMKIIKEKDRFMQNIQKQILLTLKNIVKIIGHKDWFINFKLHHSLMQIMEFMNPNNPIGFAKRLSLSNLGKQISLQDCNISNLLRKFCKRINMSNRVQIVTHIENNIQISCSSTLLNIFLLEIFKNFCEKQKYQVSLVSKNDSIYFQINGLLEIEQTQIFNKLSNILIQKIDKFPYGIQFQFYQEPQISFYK